MKVIIISGTPVDGSHYLAEILHAFGVCYAVRMPMQEALRASNPATDLLILPEGSDVRGLDFFLQTCGYTS